MRRRVNVSMLILLVLVPAVPASADRVDWHVVSSGGGVNSAAASVQLSGTVGQTAAGPALSTGQQLNSGFWQIFEPAPPDCCVGRVGDVNESGSDEPTLGDISLLIDALFISENPDVLTCLTEADVNQSGGVNPVFTDITLGDISILIDYLFIRGPYDAVENPGGVQLNDCLSP